MKPRFLVAEGNTRRRCVYTREHGLRDGSECYKQTLQAICPDATFDILFAAEVDSALPMGAQLEAYDGVIVGGSGLNIPGGESDPEILRQIEFTRSVFKSRVPFFGSCWALQIAAVAAGGQVSSSPFGRELGYSRKLSLTPEGRGSLMFEGKPSVYDSPAIHLDEVTQLPTDSVVFASNYFTAVQAASISYEGGTFWGVQYHPEFDIEHISGLVGIYSEKLIEEGFFADEDATKIYASKLHQLAQNPDRSDLAWEFGLSEDVLDAKIRCQEVENWVNHMVYPKMRQG